MRGAIWLLMVGAALPALAQTATTGATERRVDLEVAAVNRQFAGQLGSTAWQGAGVAATVTVPDFAVDVHHHRLTLVRGPQEACCRASFTAEVSGRGVVEVAVDGTEMALSDNVVAPRQALRFDGRLAVEIGEAGEVVLVLVEGPDVVSARVESRLGDSLGTICALMLGTAPCASLAARLGRAEAAGPPPGTRLELPAGAVDPETLARLRQLLR